MEPMAGPEFASIAETLVGSGLRDVLVPGMEPLRRGELWQVVDAARRAGAESIGITTNGTLLDRHLDHIANSPLTVINVSLDGPQAVHDSLRGRGVFGVVVRNLGLLRRAWPKRLVTNTTVTATNLQHLTEVARIAHDQGATYAAFHPYEVSDESGQTLAASAERVAAAYEVLVNSFSAGKTGSIALEADASTFDVLTHLVGRGSLDDALLMTDERGYLFLVLRQGGRELLVNLAAYPRHFVHTIRVVDNGGLASCRTMSKTRWRGIGDLRRAPLPDVLKSAEAIDAAAGLWLEFAGSLHRGSPGLLNHYSAVIAAAASRARTTPQSFSALAA